jgi:hypothetical protein
MEQVFFTPVTPRRCVISTTLSRPTFSDRETAGTLSETLKASIAGIERPDPPPPL